MSRIEQFFSELYAGCSGVLELRALSRAGPLTGRVFISPNDANGLTTFFGQHLHEHVYFGVATRHDATSGRADNCETLSALFADLDFKTLPEPDAWTRVQTCPFPPTAVLRSGGDSTHRPSPLTVRRSLVSNVRRWLGLCSRQN